jgi:hypothetical protein
VAGAVFTIVIFQLFPLGTAPDSLSRFVLTCNLAIAPVGVVLRRYARGARVFWGIALGTFLGIIGGVLAAALYDLFFRQIDHNMIPIEMVLFCFLFMPGMLAGLAIGKAI